MLEIELQKVNQRGKLRSLALAMEGTERGALRLISPLKRRRDLSL